MTRRREHGYTLQDRSKLSEPKENTNQTENFSLNTCSWHNIDIRKANDIMEANDIQYTLLQLNHLQKRTFKLMPTKTRTKRPWHNKKANKIVRVGDNGKYFRCQQKFEQHSGKYKKKPVWTSWRTICHSFAVNRKEKFSVTSGTDKFRFDFYCLNCKHGKSRLPRRRIARNFDSKHIPYNESATLEKFYTWRWTKVLKLAHYL